MMDEAEAPCGCGCAEAPESAPVPAEGPRVAVLVVAPELESPPALLPASWLAFTTYAPLAPSPLAHPELTPTHPDDSGRAGPIYLAQQVLRL